MTRLIKRTVTASHTFLIAALLPGLLLAARPPQTARAAEAPQEELAPLETLLNPDGSLDLSTGFSGALAPAGHRMEYAPDGAPRFLPAREPAAPRSPANTWNALGLGLNGAFRAIAVISPEVYIAAHSSTPAPSPSPSPYILTPDRLRIR